MSPSCSYASRRFTGDGCGSRRAPTTSAPPTRAASRPATSMSSHARRSSVNPSRRTADPKPARFRIAECDSSGYRGRVDRPALRSRRTFERGPRNGPRNGSCHPSPSSDRRRPSNRASRARVPDGLMPRARAELRRIRTRDVPQCDKRAVVRAQVCESIAEVDVIRHGSLGPGRHRLTDCQRPKSRAPDLDADDATVVGPG